MTEKPAISPDQGETTESPAVWIDPARLLPWSRNPRKITDEAVSKVADAITRFGWGAPIVAQATTLRIIAGHTRQRAGIKLGMPLVPVRLLAIDDRAAEAMAIADNRLAELVEWDEGALDSLLTELDSEGWDRTLLGFEALLAEPAEDPAPQPLVHDGPATSEAGSVYRLGPHVLVCGDSATAGPWAQLDEIRGARGYDVVWTDPPYGVSYESRGGGESHGTNARAGGQHAPIANDDLTVEELQAFLAVTLRPAYDRTELGGAWYVAAPAGSQQLAFAIVLSGMPTLWRHGLVWRKDSLVLGRSDRHYQHEPLFYGWREGGPHRWTGGRKRTSVIEIDRPKVSADHPTMKPVELIEECISCHRADPEGGELVLDPFGGSGSTLIAAARLRMVAHTIELDPHYCDVIRKRWGEYADRAGLERGDAL